MLLVYSFRKRGARESDRVVKGTCGVEEGCTRRQAVVAITGRWCKLLLTGLAQEASNIQAVRCRCRSAKELEA